MNGKNQTQFEKTVVDLEQQLLVAVYSGTRSALEISASNYYFFGGLMCMVWCGLSSHT